MLEVEALAEVLRSALLAALAPHGLDLEAYVADYSLLREQASVAPETLDLPSEQRIEMLLDAARQGGCLR